MELTFNAWVWSVQVQIYKVGIRKVIFHTEKAYTVYCVEVFMEFLHYVGQEDYNIELYIYEITTFKVMIENQFILALGLCVVIMPVYALCTH